MRIHEDHRRRMVAAIFSDMPGDINLVSLAPGVTIAWHRHQQQTDYLYCLKGKVKVGIVRARKRTPEWHILTGDMETVLEIPPNSWHGYANLLDDTRSVVLGYISQHYTPGDEERKSIDEMGIPW